MKSNCHNKPRIFLRAISLSFFLLISVCPVVAQSWPTVTREAKPGTRWWWLGSAVDKKNLQWTMRQYGEHGIGAVEITPLYGVQGNQQTSDKFTPGKNIDYLSDRWMDMLRFTQSQGELQDIEIDMATGTGWPFGGPWVPLEESACKVVWKQATFRNDKNSPIIGYDMSPSEKDAKYCRLLKVMAYPMGDDYKKIRSVKKMPKQERLAWRLDFLRNHIGRGIDITHYIKDGKLTIKSPKKIMGSHAEVVAIYVRYGVMKVKRAAPGGEGLVIDHFDKKAVANYLKHIEDAFERTNTPYPHTFFNDSYEVSEATWTPTLFQEFEKRRGYKLEEKFYQLITGVPEIVSDYRETLSELLLENFTEQWTAWAHKHGAITRNQAHGSPANLIDCYAAVDIPEIEGFGLSEFGIKGLRTDPGMTRKNDSDYSMFKYAPSAAHICGKPYTSSETFTWLTEHFRTSLSQLKPDLDLMFCAGVNHMFFHGTCYSPQDDPWPGWKFYASIDMSPTNSIWRDAPYFMKYVERCQSFLQWGQPDNDFLVLLPVRDMWKKNTNKLLMQFSIHAMGKLAPEFIKTILDIDRAGFDCDYISEKLLMDVRFQNGMLVTKGGTRYKGLIIPGSGNIPNTVKAHIEKLRSQGARIFYNVDSKALSQAARPETFKTANGLKAIRRKNPTGYHYFIANLTPEDIDIETPLAVDFKSAAWFNPLNGEIIPAKMTPKGIRISLRCGESMILQTWNNKVNGLDNTVHPMTKKKSVINDIVLEGPWRLSFIDEMPKVNRKFYLDKLKTWEKLDDDSVRITMGTGVYTISFWLPNKETIKGKWQIDLGDVRESARVYINGQFIGCAWSVPFTLDFKDVLKPGDNTVRIEVTNLPANRIRDLDRRGVKWRKMEEINVVDINYKKTTYENWEPVPSGLNSKVRLIKINE